jgi:hypothetical protein
VGEHDAFGFTGRSTRGHDECISLLDREPICQMVLTAIGAHDAGRSEGGQERVPGRPGQARIERCGSVAGVPDGPQRIDEARSPGKVECDEFRHWR